MKKMLLTASFPFITGCAQQTFTVQNKPAAVAPKETITHHFFLFLELGRRKLSMQPKFVAAQKNVVKTETQQKINGLLGFITLGIYTGQRVYCSHNIVAELPIDMGNSICTAH